MSDRPQDTELRARFEAQRRADAGEAPSFAEMMARVRAQPDDTSTVVATSSRKLRRVVYWSGLAAAAVIGALLALPGSSSQEDAFEQAVRAYQNGPAMGAWRSPTDGLLDVPGSRLISTVPSVGTQ